MITAAAAINAIPGGLLEPLLAEYHASCKISWSTVGFLRSQVVAASVKLFTRSSTGTAKRVMQLPRASPAISSRLANG